LFPFFLSFFFLPNCNGEGGLVYKLFLITGQRERKEKKDGWAEGIFLE
jgi:hypothetical protein